MKKEIVLIALTGDKRTDEFMHSMDMFESFKRYATEKVITLNVNATFNIAKVIISVKEAFEKAGENVVCVFIPGDKISAFIDEDVKAVSDGKKFFLLDTYLKRYEVI